MAEALQIKTMADPLPAAVGAFLDREWAAFAAEAFWGAGIETVPVGDGGAEDASPSPSETDARLDDGVADPGAGADYPIDTFHLVAERPAPSGGPAGEVLGVASVSMDGGVASLRELIVAAHARGLGVGGCLLSAFEAAARAYGCHKLAVRTLADTRQEQFYRHRGYRREARLDCDQFRRDWVLLCRFPD